MFLDILVGEVQTSQVAEFGHCCFAGHVAARDEAQFEGHISGGVDVEDDALVGLTDIDDHCAFLRFLLGVLKEELVERALSGNVTHSIGLNNQIFGVQLRRGPERSQLQQTHQRVRFQFPENSRLIDLAGTDELPLYLDLEPQLADMVVIGAAEGVEGGNRCLGCPVAPHQRVVEQQQHLGNLVVSGYHQRTEQVVYGVISGLPNWDYVMKESTLGSSEDYRFLEVFDHEREGAGSEAHGVSAVEDDEGIEVCVDECLPS
jgi:hypothetical protein